jgi:ribonuclease P protein component
LDVFVSPSPAERSRVGIVVPRHKQTAVKRNLLKRRLREVVRTQVLPQLHQSDASHSLLIRARREAYDAPYQDLARELLEWAQRIS